MDAKALFLNAVRFHQAGELTKAIDLYRASLQAMPGNDDAALYLALALQQTGALNKAESAYREAARRMPKDPDVLNGLGSISLELGKAEEAKLAHLKALKIAPESAEAHGGLGNVYLSQGLTEEAISSFQISLGIAPDSPDTMSNLGVALKTAGRTREAVDVFEAALRLNPDSAETLYNLGNAWQARGDMGKALAAYHQAQEITPNGVAPRWGACFAHLDITFDQPEQIAASREAYARALAELDEFLTLDTPKQIREAATVVGANQPFYLTYQGRNDRDLQAQYGNIVHRVMTTAFPQFKNPVFERGPSDKIRVGIATGFLHEHSVWKIPTRGWVRHLDRSKFELFGYYTGVKTDHCTKEARQLFDKLTHEPNHFEQLCRTILSDRLDVLIYPDIGMDPTCAKLAGLRLAPAQCVSLGHPMTTGLPTMDYYLSSALMEPEDGDAAYTEELVRLPNLSIHYEPIRHGEPQFDRNHFGLPKDALLYFCPQSLYKYLPQYDKLFPLIAKQVPNSQFVFLKNDRADVLDHRFFARLAMAFADHGVDFSKHIIMLPQQGPDEYYALNCLCDVFLDSIEWSGFNTAMEAVNADLPLVIYPKGHMRGRHSQAVASMLELDEGVATSFDNYVELAVKAGNDSLFRKRLAKKITANRSRLFRDMEAIRGLEYFLKQVAR